MKYQNIYNRLRRIEGTIRGIEQMIEKDRGEEDILIQLEAAKSSLASAICSLLESTLKKNLGGEIVLTEGQIKTLLRMIKKT